MATYTGEHAAAAIAELIEAGGEGDGLLASKIVEYRDLAGRVCWGVVFQTDPDQEAYERLSPYVLNPRVIWTRDEGGA